ncbi:uncharacterized protein LOC133777628 [Humulus lupulus]|uniref:uncharacterized protein LOC133777628 n=1 Tax=Humulus lupulus TaxID=3486 RepID=UPI002B403A04|nr:uncharacterized protein LOC133777628 [Humulus lupulus]
MFEFDSTLDLIHYIVSNNLFIFCFCNLIVVIILMCSNKTGRERQSSESVVKKQSRSGNGRRYEESKSCVGVSKGLINAEKGEDENDRADRANDEENDKKDDKDEDELRKRVEEFIEKVNKEWKTEMWRT